MRELVYGIHVIQSIFDKNSDHILKVYVICKPRDVRLETLIHRLSVRNISIYERTRRWFNNKVTRSVCHQGILAEIIKFPHYKESDLVQFLENCSNVPLLLVLDGITDPHNLGACLRSADAAGVNMVIAPKNRSAYINSTVRKVASGSAEVVSFVRVTNLSRTLKLLQRYHVQVVGMVVKADTVIFNAELTGPLALVMGSEGSGIRHITKKNCDALIQIPMLRPNTSLNVSVATGICLFEVLRQRKYNI